VSKLVEFKDLDYSDEFIVDPASIRDEEDIIVFTKRQFAGGGGDVGVSNDRDGKHKILFEPTRKVLKVFARRADKV